MSLCAALGICTGQGWTCWDGFGGGHRDALKTGASLLQGQAETTGAAQPGEDKVWRSQSWIPSSA